MCPGSLEALFAWSQVNCISIPASCLPATTTDPSLILEARTGQESKAKGSPADRDVCSTWRWLDRSPRSMTALTTGSGSSRQKESGHCEHKSLFPQRTRKLKRLQKSRHLEFLLNRWHGAKWLSISHDFELWWWKKRQWKRIYRLSPGHSQKRHAGV